MLCDRNKNCNSILQFIPSPRRTLLPAVDLAKSESTVTSVRPLIRVQETVKLADLRGMQARTMQTVRVHAMVCYRFALCLLSLSFSFFLSRSCTFLTHWSPDPCIVKPGDGQKREMLITRLRNARAAILGDMGREVVSQVNALCVHVQCLPL